jgi:hypothetical protein
MASSGDHKISAGSIMKDLIWNQYQAIVLGGAAVASLITLNPIPLLVWLGSEMVLLPVLDSGPLRRMVHRKRHELNRKEAAAKRASVIASFNPANAKRYSAMENLCRLIEANYQGLHGISQVYLSEQRDKLDMILEGCLHRMMALQRYERMLLNRDPQDIEREVLALEQELKQAGHTERARAALQKNVELKRKLLASYVEAGGTMKALATELDSMFSLLEVLHQNSISMRDPQAISEELDTIVRQSEDSERAVREMESMLGSSADWALDSYRADDVAAAPLRSAGSGPARQKVKDR